MEKSMGKHLFTKFIERNIKIMNDNNYIKKIIRRLRKVLFLREKRQDYVKILRKKSLDEGKKQRLKHSGYIFKCNTLKPMFYLPLYKEDYIQQRILTEKNYYEYDDLDFICKRWNGGIVSQTIKDGCIVDIGANIGNHTLYFFFECEIKNAICFEPVESTYNTLQRNMEINGVVQNVTLINGAVGASVGTARISHYDISNTGSTKVTLDNTGEIFVVSIDSMSIEDDIKLVKIDVEGFEKNVIEGCMETLGKHKPYIMIEIQPENFDSISHELSKMSYRYIHINKFNYLFYC